MDENKGVQSGAKREHTCSSCGAVYQGHFCPACGTPTEEEMSYCPVCGMERDEDAKYCQNCGFSYAGKKFSIFGRSRKGKAGPAPKVFHTKAALPKREEVGAGAKSASLAHHKSGKTIDAKVAILICVVAVVLLTWLFVDMVMTKNREPVGATDEFIFFTNGKNAVSVKYNKTDCEGETIVVPASYNGLPVTAVYGGFAGKNMVAVELPASVITVQSGAFANCKKLTSISMGSVSTIESGAFRDCTSLTSITLRGQMDSIGGGAFYGCTALTSVTLPENENFQLGSGAFAACTALTQVNMGGLKNIPENAFYKCTSLTKIYFSNVKVIGKNAFGSCNKLSDVYLPESIVTVEDEAFSNCFKMTHFTLGKNVTNLGVRVLAGCSALETLSVESGNIKYANDANNKAIYDSRKDEVVIGIKGFTMEEMISCVNIAPYAFAYSEITTLDIPNNVEVVGEGAFEGCEKLTSVTFGQNFRYLGRNAFKGCTALSYVHLTTTEWCSWQSESDDGVYDPSFALTGMDDPVNVADMMRTKENFYYVSALTGAGEEFATEATFTLYVKNEVGGIGGVSVRLRNIKTGKYTDFAVTDQDGMVTIVAPLYTYDVQVIVPYGYTHEDQYRLTTGEIVLDTMLPEGITEGFAVILFYSETEN